MIIAESAFTKFQYVIEMQHNTSMDSVNASVGQFGMLDNPKMANILQH